METVYLRGPKKFIRTPRWCSRSISFKTYFSQYSEELDHVLKDNVFAVLGQILPEAKGFTPKELETLQEAIDPKKFRGIHKAVSAFDKDEPSTSGNNFPSASNQSSVSDRGKLSSQYKISRTKKQMRNEVKKNKPKCSLADGHKMLEKVKNLNLEKILTSENLSSVSLEADSNLSSSTEYLNPQEVNVTCQNESDSDLNSLHVNPNVENTEVKRSSRIKRKPESGAETAEKIAESVGKVDCNETLFSEENIANSMQSAREQIKKVKMTGSRLARKKNHYKNGLVHVDTTRKLGRKDLMPGKNFLVSFRIHRPFKRMIGEKGVRIGKCAQELVLVNYQTLSDLREAICCEADYQDTSGDVSGSPDFSSNQLSKDKYKSSMFYFDNTFYIDSQNGTEDYSVVIREWAEPRGILVGETRPMDEMKVEDLEVRLGYPYVYKHQGSCEHLVIISCARLLGPKDSQFSSDYPNLTKLSRSCVAHCVTCHKRPASWIVSGSDRMFHDYNMMCDACFKSYHYIEGQKVGEFKAHRWMQRAVLFA